MRLRVRRRSAVPKRSPGSKAGTALLFVCIVAGLGWFGWNKQWFHVPKSKEPVKVKPAAPSQRLAQLPISTNPPVIQRTDPVQPPIRQSVPPRQTNSPALPIPPVPPVRTTQAASVAQLPSNKSAAVLEAQIVLDRLSISPGSIDGVMGAQTRAAVRAFQLREGLPMTGELDTNTRPRLTLSASVLTNYSVMGTESERLHPVANTWLGKSEQERLDYETLLEMVAERSHAHPNLIRRLNPALNWESLPPGSEILVPGTEREPARSRAAYLRISLSGRTLEAFDESDGLLAHFPCSIAQRVEKRPMGELHVAVTAPNPNYTFNPDVFPESAEARELARKLVIPPGPNNPVGTVWIGLDKPGYGIHGTPRPEEVGRTESHGCFRLANWNAETLLRLVTVGTPVRVEP